MNNKIKLHAIARELNNLNDLICEMEDKGKNVEFLEEKEDFLTIKFKEQIKEAFSLSDKMQIIVMSSKIQNLVRRNPELAS